MNPVLDDVDNVSALQSTSIENGVRDVAVNTGGRFGTIWELLKWFKKNTMRDILLKFHEFLEQNRTDWRLANKHYFLFFLRFIFDRRLVLYLYATAHS